MANTVVNGGTSEGANKPLISSTADYVSSKNYCEIISAYSYFMRH